MIIGLVGNESSGKSTMAEHLCSRHGFTRLHSMEPVNALLADLYGFTAEQLSGASASRNEPHPTIPDLTARKAQKDLGMAIRRLYASTLIDRMFRVHSDVEHVAVENVRFLDEVQAIKRRGGKVIRLRGGVVSDHPTETEQLSIPDREFDAILSFAADKRERFEILDVLVWAWRGSE